MVSYYAVSFQAGQVYIALHTIVTMLQQQLNAPFLSLNEYLCSHITETITDKAVCTSMELSQYIINSIYGIEQGNYITLFNWCNRKK